MIKSFAFQQLKKDFLWDFSYKISFFGQYVGMIITIITFYFLGETFKFTESSYLEPYNYNYFLFSVIGIAFIDFASAVIRSISSSIRNAQTFGYIDNIINPNQNIFYVVATSAIYPTLKGFVKFSLYLFFASLLSGHTISPNGYFLISFCLLFSSLFLISVSFLAGSFVLIYKQGDPINYLTNILISLFSGIVYPIYTSRIFKTNI